MNVKQYLAKIGAKGGKAKSAAKTAAARKANVARWRNHKPKRVTATHNDCKVIASRVSIAASCAFKRASVHDE